MKYYSVMCCIATGIVIIAGRWSGWWLCIKYWNLLV